MEMKQGGTGFEASACPPVHLSRDHPRCCLSTFSEGAK